MNRDWEHRMFSLRRKSSNHSKHKHKQVDGLSNQKRITYIPPGIIIDKIKNIDDIVQIVSITYDVQRVLNYTIIDLYDKQGITIILYRDHGIILDRKVDILEKTLAGVNICSYAETYIGRALNLVRYAPYIYKLHGNLELFKFRVRIELAHKKIQRIQADRMQKFIIYKNLILGRDFKINIQCYTLKEALNMASSKGMFTTGDLYKIGSII